MKALGKQLVRLFESVYTSIYMQILPLIKLLHTAVWAVFVFLIGSIYYSALVQHISILTWLAIISVLAEGIVLLCNGWSCPLTRLGAMYTTDRTVGFDIYLPTWLARHNKIIFTIVYLIGVILLVIRIT